MKLLQKMAAAAVCVAAFAAFAQPAWPDKPVKLVVPYTPGAMGDVVARLVAEGLKDRLRQAVLVENKPGAGGNIGTGAVVRAVPDGYTFLIAATNNLVVNQFIFKNLGFDPLKALEPVTMLVDVPSVLFVSSAVPAKSFGEFVEWARAHPGEVNYASPGNGTTPHLSMFEIDRTLGLHMMHVPYQGATPAIQALLGNEVQAYLVGAGLGLPHVRAGKLRAVAVSAMQRLPVLPDTPTFDEVGLGKMKASNWWAVAAPRGTPKPVIERLATEVRQVLAQPKLRERLVELGVVPVAEGPQAMASQLADEAKLWERAVVQSGAKVD